jgi:hypothetical protein
MRHELEDGGARQKRGDGMRPRDAEVAARLRCNGDGTRWHDTKVVALYGATVV